MTITRTVGRNTLSSAVVRFASLGVWFLVTPRVLHALGAERFGFWSILLAFGGSLATLDLGLGVAVMRAVARLRHEGGPGALGPLLRGATLLQAGLAVALGAVILLATPGVLALFRVPADWAGEARVALAYSVGGFVLTTLNNLFLYGLQGLQRMDRVLPIAVPGALGLGVAVWWATGRPAPLVALTSVQLVYAGALALAYGALLVRMARAERATGGTGAPAPAGEAAPARPRARLRDLLRVGGWVQASAVVAFLHAQVDKFLLGALVALTPVAAYELGARVTAAASIAPMIFIASLFPEFSRAEAEAGGVRLAPLYVASLDPLFALTFGIAGAVVPLAPWILAAWLGTPPAGAALCLVVLAAATTATLLTAVSTNVVRARGDMRLEVAYGVLATGLHLVLSIVGLRLAGLPGLLAGLLVSNLVAGTWYIRRVDATLEPGARGRVWRHAWPFFASAVLAGALAFAAASALGRSPGRVAAVVSLLGGGLAYALAYAAVLRLGFRGTWRALIERGRRLHPGAA